MQPAAAFGWETLHRYLELTYSLVANFPIQRYHSALNCWWGGLQTMIPTEQPKSVTKILLTLSHTVSKLWKHRDAPATSKLISLTQTLPSRYDWKTTLQQWRDTLQYTAPCLASTVYILQLLLQLLLMSILRCPESPSPTYCPTCSNSKHLRCSSFRLSS